MGATGCLAERKKDKFRLTLIADPGNIYGCPKKEGQEKMIFEKQGVCKRREYEF
jgi:hypothetical protein